MAKIVRRSTRSEIARPKAKEKTSRRSSKREAIENLNARLHVRPVEADYAKVADRFFSNRMITAEKMELPLSDLFSFMPLCCNYCLQERNPQELKIGLSHELMCVDEKNCTRVLLDRPSPIPDVTKPVRTRTGKVKRPVKKTGEVAEKGKKITRRRDG